MSDDKRTMWEIIFTALTGIVAWVFGAHKRKTETKLAEIDLDEKLSERDKKRIKDLINDIEQKDKKMKEQDKALQDAYRLLTDTNIKLHDAMEQIDDLKRKIATMSLTHK